MFFFYFRPKTAADVDSGPSVRLPKFRPAKKPGVHLSQTRDMLTKSDVGEFLSPVSFFKLYFTVHLVKTIVMYTNNYAAHFRPTRPSVFKGWYKLTIDEFFFRFEDVHVHCSSTKCSKVLVHVVSLQWLMGS